jgi:CheY-like chemotaxis protein
LVIAQYLPYATIRNMSIPRILLVDDQREVSRMLRASLELSGKDYIVVDVPSGEEALLELGRGPVDLLVTDLRLPGISGLELLVKVRQLNPDARAIMITGHPSEEAQEEAEKLGVVAFLPKPIGTSIFLDAVERALTLRGPVGPPIRVRSKARIKLEERLDEVRRELGAGATLLIDDSREVIGQSGDLRDLNLTESMPSLMTAFSAGLKVSNLIGALLPGNLLYFDGDTHDLYLTNIGAYYALLIVFHGKGEAGQMGAVVHFGRRAADDLMDLLSSLGELDSEDEESDAEEEPAVQWDEDFHRPPQPSDEVSKGHRSTRDKDEVDMSEEEELSDLEISGEEIKQEDAEEFWEQAVSETPVVKDSEDNTLSFDEAKTKGILADQSKEKAEEEGKT